MQIQILAQGSLSRTVTTSVIVTSLFFASYYFPFLLMPCSSSVASLSLHYSLLFATKAVVEASPSPFSSWLTWIKPQPIFAEGKRCTCWMLSVSTRLCKNRDDSHSAGVSSTWWPVHNKNAKGLDSFQSSGKGCFSAHLQHCCSGGLITPCGATCSCEKAAQHQYECVLPIEEIFTALIFCHSPGFLLVSTEYYWLIY